MDVLGRQLQQQKRDGVITAFVVWPSGHNAFQVAAPTNAIEWQKEWRRQFLAHHDPRNNLVSADAVRNFADGRTQGLTVWLELPACAPLRQALNQHPGLPRPPRLEGGRVLRFDLFP